MSEDHGALIGLSDRELKLRAGDATHQHFKGGLYRLVGVARDADTGGLLYGKDGNARVLYEHVYPHERGFWVRDHTEFHGNVEREGYRGPRFRRLG